MGVQEEADEVVDKKEFIQSAIEKIRGNHEISEDTKNLLTQERVWADLWEYRRNSAWFYQHLNEIKKQYAGRLVLVLHREVIFSSEDAGEAIRALRGLGDRMNQCYVHCVPRSEEMQNFVFIQPN